MLASVDGVKLQCTETFHAFSLDFFFFFTTGIVSPIRPEDLLISVFKAILHSALNTLASLAQLCTMGDRPLEPFS